MLISVISFNNGFIQILIFGLFEYTLAMTIFILLKECPVMI
jgi:hypothetical protein